MSSGRDEFIRQYEQLRTRYVREAQDLFGALRRIDGLVVYPSQANFALLELVNGAAAHDLVSRLLLEHGIYARDCADKIGLEGEFVRIAARSAMENQQILRGVGSAIQRRASAGTATRAMSAPPEYVTVPGYVPTDVSVHV